MPRPTKPLRSLLKPGTLWTLGGPDDRWDHNESIGFCVVKHSSSSGLYPPKCKWVLVHDPEKDNVAATHDLKIGGGVMLLDKSGVLLDDDELTASYNHFCVFLAGDQVLTVYTDWFLTHFTLSSPAPPSVKKTTS